MKAHRLIVAIFALSGAAGLVYEVVWARQLVLVFGNTTHAVSAILAGFFGGMAIGSAVGGRYADRARKPLRIFGFLEIGLAAVVLLTPATFGLINYSYRVAFGALENSPALLTAVRFSLALLALGPATILMGATLPTLARHLTRDPAKLGVAFGSLYAANTVGAIVGTVLAGFVLIELLGLAGTLLVGATFSVTAGAIALLIDRAGSGDSEKAIRVQDETVEADGPRTWRVPATVVLGVSFASGFTALGYQVLWTRLLASGTGNSTYVFTAILALFLAGLASGALAFAWYRPRIADPVNFIAHGQLMIAILVCIGAITGISNQVTGFVSVGENFGALFMQFVGTVALIVLPATFVMGLTFPALATLAEGHDGRVGTRAGMLLAANTTGAIVATIAIPFWLVPAVGSPAALAILAIANTAVAMTLAYAGGIERVLPRRVLLVAGFTIGIGILGALRMGGLFVDPAVAWIQKVGRLFESREDHIASVQAGRGMTEQLWVTGTTMTVLTVDAKLMALFPLMLRPDSRSALTVAFGMGSTFRTALIAGLEVDAVELVPSVPRMFRWFYPDAKEVMANPRGNVFIADGRNYMELARKQYDIIITDPPPPLESAGVSVIASREYYQAGKERLTNGGIMMQWLPYGQTVDEFKSHVRTFSGVFDHVMIAVGPGGNGFFFFGSVEPIALDTGSVLHVLARPGVLGDLSSAFDSPARSLEGWAAFMPGLVWLSGQRVSDFAGNGAIITDDRPIPEYFLIRHLLKPPVMMTRADVGK